MRTHAQNAMAGGSVNHICEAGINKGLVYHNYKDKDALHLECVQKSCKALICYIADQNAENSFVDYMSARKALFEEHELEAYIFLEARTSPPKHLNDQIGRIYTKLDELNRTVHEMNIHRLFDLMLYGIAEGGKGA